MKFTSVEIGIISLLLLGFLYFYNNPLTVYKQKPVYYPVYQNRYIPVEYNYDVFRPRPFHRRPHRHNNNNFPPGVRFDKNNKPIPGSGGGGV
jgi:hypothetical protein